MVDLAKRNGYGNKETDGDTNSCIELERRFICTLVSGPALASQTDHDD